MKVNYLINGIICFVLLLLWSSVFFIKGIYGAVSWSLLKIFLSPIGCIILFISVILLIIKIFRKESIRNMIVRTILSLILAAPILMLLNIIKMPYPANVNETIPKLTIESPFKEDVLIGWGGDKLSQNKPHVIWASERWAYDIIANPKRSDSHKLEDYGIYDMNLYAPIAGYVIGAYDGEVDIEPQTEKFKSMEGNYVYLFIEDTKTYLLMNHLKYNSLAVKIGDYVEKGTYLGKIGNSGTTSEPHLHIHHQRQNPTTTIHPTFAEGLPLYFYNKDRKSNMPVAGKILKAFSK